MASFSWWMAPAALPAWTDIRRFRKRNYPMKLNEQFFRRTDLDNVPGGARELVGYGEHPPRVRWQNGAKVAVQIVINYEEGSEKTFAMGDGVNDGMYELP